MDASTSGRPGGRGLEEFRTVFIKTRVLSQAKGSAYAEFGTTKVMVGVFGPRQSEIKLGFTDIGRLNCEVKLTSFAAARLSEAEQSSLESSMASALQQALEASVQLDRFPKAVFDVSAMVLEAGGGEAAVAATAASVALADAGIELYDIVPAVQLSKQPGGSLLLDPTTWESAREEGALLLATMASPGAGGGGAGEGGHVVTLMALRGAWGDGELREGLELGMGACAQLREVMRDALVAAVEEGAQ